jgi:hypothetical protein
MAERNRPLQTCPCQDDCLQPTQEYRDVDKVSTSLAGYRKRPDWKPIAAPTGGEQIPCSDLAEQRHTTLKEPRRPTNAELLRAGLEFLPNDVREDFGSYLYWNAELQA